MSNDLGLKLRENVRKAIGDLIPDETLEAYIEEESRKYNYLVKEEIKKEFQKLAKEEAKLFLDSFLYNTDFNNKRNEMYNAKLREFIIEAAPEIISSMFNMSVSNAMQNLKSYM